MVSGHTFRETRQLFNIQLQHVHVAKRDKNAGVTKTLPKLFFSKKWSSLFTHLTAMLSSSAQLGDLKKKPNIMHI